MTVWLLNLAAYSLQLAVLVGTGAVMMTLLQVSAPRTMLRFWQALFAVCLLGPACQLWVNLDASREASAGGVVWSVATSNAALIRAGSAAIDAGAATLVVALLAAGAAIKLGWLGLGLMRLRTMRAAAEPAHALSPVLAVLQRELGVSADVRFSEAVNGPATIGARHPIVLLPPSVCGLAPAVQRAILCHELMHVRQRDWLAALLEELWCATLWFHPAARALSTRLSLAREMRADEATIAHTRDRQAYAAALLEFSTHRSRLLGATALIGRRHLEQRIALIAQEVSMNRSSLALRLAVAVSVVAATTLATAAYIPMSAAAQTQTEKIYRAGDGITMPRVVKEVRPQYTPAALKAKIQGSVELRVVVLASGSVGEVTVTRSLDQEHGLDQQAIDAVRQWTFTPGAKDGKAVPVEVTIVMTFTLRE